MFTEHPEWETRRKTVSAPEQGGTGPEKGQVGKGYRETGFRDITTLSLPMRTLGWTQSRALSTQRAPKEKGPTSGMCTSGCPKWGEDPGASLSSRKTVAAAVPGIEAGQGQWTEAPQASATKCITYSIYMHIMFYLGLQEAKG